MILYSVPIIQIENYSPETSVRHFETAVMVLVNVSEILTR